jgi:hypothetical protein
MSVENPREVPEAHALIRRLCVLQAAVAGDVLGYDHPADCFCGDDGFWPYQDAGDYRNDGEAVAFIEAATWAAIETHKQAPT